MRKINTDLPDYIGSYSINSLIPQLESLEEESELSWNSFGGSVYAGQQFIDFLNNKEQKITAKITGIAASMGAAILPFFDYVIAAEQADIMLHSASGGSSSTLKNTNTFLYESLAKKIDEVKFEKVTGKNLKKIMLAEGSDREDIWITGKQGKKVGLIDETFNLLEKAASINPKDINDLGYNLPENIKEKYGLINKNVNNNEMEIKDVTVTQLQEGNPEVFKAIFNQGKQAKANQVTKVMKYAKYDMDKAAKLIESDNDLSTDDVEYFMEKKYSNEKLANLENDGEELNPAIPPKKVEEVKPTEKQAALEDLDKNLNPEFYKQ